jgi:MYXO-CTERM domain-containing protein
MNLLKNMLVVIAAIGAMGSAQAQTNLGTLSPTVQTETHFFGAGSFADIFNFTVDASHNIVSTSTVPLAPNGTISSTSVTGLQLALFSGFNAPGGTTPLFTGLDLNALLLTPGEFSARITGTAGQFGGGIQFSIAASPEPAEWMLLLAGLVGLGFVARRKIGLVAGAPA